jgi:hypothetical protein
VAGAYRVLKVFASVGTFGGKLVSVLFMTRMRLAKVVLALDLVVLVGCRTEPSRQEQSRAPQITVSTTESSPSRSGLSDDTCGLDDFPVSKSTGKILAAAPRDGGRPPNQMMLAKVAINAEGKVTHLRVLRLAWPKLPNSYAINEQAVDSIKGWHYRPTIVGGKPVAVCSEVGVTVDLE